MCYPLSYGSLCFSFSIYFSCVYYDLVWCARLAQYAPWLQFTFVDQFLHGIKIVNAFLWFSDMLSFVYIFLWLSFMFLCIVVMFCVLSPMVFVYVRTCSCDASWYTFPVFCSCCLVNFLRPLFFDRICSLFVTHLYSEAGGTSSCRFLRTVKKFLGISKQLLRNSRIVLEF